MKGIRLNYLKLHPGMPTSRHPINHMVLHSRYPIGIPPASSHASADIAHPSRGMPHHFPPFSSHCISSNIVDIAKLERKMIAGIVITIKTIFELLRGTITATKFVLNYPYFTLEMTSQAKITLSKNGILDFIVNEGC